MTSRRHAALLLAALALPACAGQRSGHDVAGPDVTVAAAVEDGPVHAAPEDHTGADASAEVDPVVARMLTTYRTYRDHQVRYFAVADDHPLLELLSPAMRERVRALGASYRDGVALGDPDADPVAVAAKVDASVATVVDLAPTAVPPAPGADRHELEVCVERGAGVLVPGPPTREVVRFVLHDGAWRLDGVTRVETRCPRR